MYILTPKAIEILKTTPNLRMRVAMRMGNTEQAVISSLYKKGSNGRSIANNYDAINELIDSSGLTLDQIRETEPKTETTPA